MTSYHRWLAAFAVALVATVIAIIVVDRPAASFAHDIFRAPAPFVALTHIVDPILCAGR